LEYFITCIFSKYGSSSWADAGEEMEGCSESSFSGETVGVGALKKEENIKSQYHNHLFICSIHRW
jgi:hypothetical protein